MTLSVTIPNSIYEKYQLLHKTKNEDEVKALLKARLTRWLEILVLSDPDDRSILLGGDDRRALEKIFAVTVDSAADLIKKTDALSKVSVGTLTFNLSPGESVRLAEQARFHGWPPDQFFHNTCAEIVDRFMDRI